MNGDDEMAKNGNDAGDTNRAARNAGKEQALRDRRANRGDGRQADWGSANGNSLARAIASVTRHGYAILLGYTSDQGAYTIRIVGLENIKPDYVRPTEDLDRYLDDLAEDFGAL